MGRNIKNKKRNSDLNMKIVVTDFKLENYVCTPFLDGTSFDFMDRERFKEWLVQMGKEIYFVCVEDKTWKKWKISDAKRVQLTLDELIKLIEESGWLVLINENHTEACMYYPKDD